VDSIEHILVRIAEMFPWFLPVVMVVFGGIFGSFLTCMVYRIPRKLNPAFPPSYCPSCNQPLRAVDLIPVLSWLLFRGKCRMCKTVIPFRYIAIELLTIAWALTALVVTPSFVLLPFLFFSGVGFLFVVLCLAMEKVLPLKVLLFSCMLLALFFFFCL
jgi:leader peptidase (prepilin peptidase)/N-methyltransferase